MPILLSPSMLAESRAAADEQAKKIFAKQKQNPAAGPRYADEGSIYRKEDLDEFYSTNLGYLVASGVKAVENVSNMFSLATGQFEDIPEASAINANPENVHGAVRIIGDIGQTMLPFFVPGVGLGVGTATLAATTGIESVNAGMDATTAGARTAFAGGSAVAMAALQPLSGKALGALMEGKTLSSVLEVGKSALANIGIGVTQRGIDYQMVKAKYPEFAEKMEVLGATTIGTDIALWGLFAGLGYKGIRAELKKAGYSVTQANKAIRAAEEAAGADTAVNDAIYTRRANKSYEDDGPLLSQEEYAVKRAVIDEAITRVENAEPMPDEVPDAIKAEVPPVNYLDKVPVSETDVTKFVTDFGIDSSRVAMHTSDNMPDYAVESAMREGGDINTAEAWMGNDGVLHINLDAFSDMNRLKDVVGFHEITHAGQDAAIISKAHAALFEAQGEKTDFLRSEMKRIAKQRGYDLLTEDGTNRAVREATAEVMMDAVYRGHVADIMNETYFSKLINSVKDLLRDMGVKIKYTDEDAARLIGTMWYKGKKKLESKIDVDWKTTLEGLEQETFTRTGKKDGNYYTESAFQDYLKEFYPSVHGGQYDKKDIISTLKNLAKGSTRKLTDKQKEIRANFERDMEIAKTERAQIDTDLPFSIKPDKDMEGTVKVDELTADGEIEKVVRPAKEVVKEYQDKLNSLSGFLNCLRGI